MQKIIFEDKVVRCYFKSSNGRDLSPEVSARIANTITESRKEIEQKDLEIDALNLELSGKELQVLDLKDAIERAANEAVKTSEFEYEAPSGIGVALALIAIISAIVGIVIGANI